MPFIRLLSLPVGERGVVSIPPHLRGGAIKHIDFKFSNFFRYSNFFKYFKFHTSET